MKHFISTALGRTRTVLLLLGLCFVWGMYAYLTIPKESTPDVKIPIIYVELNFEGISPQDSERLLLRPIEQELRSIEGLKEMRSTAYEGGGSVLLEFKAGFNSEKAHTDVHDKLDIVKPKLPLGLKEPVINEINLGLMPILLVKLSGDAPVRSLYRLARELKDEIEGKITSVLRAEIVGDREESLEILLKPVQQEKYGLILAQVFENFSRNHALVAAGNLEHQWGSFSIKVPGILENAEDISNLPILIEGKSVVRLKDIAEVRRTFKDPKTLAKDRTALGQSTQTVVLEISKRTGENLIQTVAEVKRVVAEAQKHWPDHISINYAQDDSADIKDMLNELQNSVIFTIILVMAVIVFFLGWKSAMLVGIAVPGSFLIGIMVISLLGYTVNVVVLFSLIFSVGMLVDGAIIVVEYADHLIEEGTPVTKAYLEAALRMTWPVITSTVTILVVFLPLLFWPGVVGQFMKYMPITLIAVLTASIFMALIFVPAIAGLLKKIDSSASAHQHDSLFKRLSKWYLGVLNKALNQPKKVLYGAGLILILVYIIYSLFGRGMEFFPDTEPDSAAIHIHARGNLSIYEKEALVSQVEKTILDMAEFKSVYSRIGEQSKDVDAAEDVIGIITLEFIDWKHRRKVADILEEVTKRVNEVPGVVPEILTEKSGPPNAKPIDIQISASNPSLLLPSLKKVRSYLESMAGLISIEDSLPLPSIEWKIKIDREKATKLGCDITTIGNTLRMITNGTKVATYRPDDAADEIDILLRFAPEYRTLDQLDKIRVQTLHGSIPLNLVAKRIPELQVTQIERVNGQRILSLKADVSPGVLAADKISEIERWLKNADLDPNVQLKFKGEDEDRKESGAFLMKAFAIAIFLVATILVTQFNSFFSMGLVLSAVLMSTVGVLVGLLVHHMAFGVVMGGIGVIALAGIIVSNNILLIDTYDLLMKELKEKVAQPTVAQLREVIVRTCEQRLRPVLLTKLATVLGLLPIMFGINIDFLHLEITQGAPSSQWWVLLATCIVYGVLFASCLTLIVTPCALMIRARQKFPN